MALLHQDCKHRITGRLTNKKLQKGVEEIGSA